MRYFKQFILPIISVLIIIPRAYSTPIEAPHTPGAYLQWQGGIGGIDTRHYSPNLSPYEEVSLHRGLAYRLSLGYLLAQEKFNYGLELGYAGYPQNTYAFSFPSLSASGNEAYKGHLLDLLAVIKPTLWMNSNHKIYLIGTAGAAYVTQTFHGQSTAFNTLFVLNKTIKRVEPETALGMGYLINKKIDINLCYHHVFAGRADPIANSLVDPSLIPLSAINLVMLGLSYHFA